MMKLILTIVFWLIVFAVLGLFLGDTVVDTILIILFSIWISVFLLFVIVLIKCVFLAKKIQTALNSPKDLDLKQQTTDEFFTNKPQALHDYHKQMLDNDFVLNKTLIWENNNQHYDMGIYYHSTQNTVVGIIYHINSIELNQIFVHIEFCENYDNNQSIAVNNAQIPMPFLDISDDIVVLQMPDVATVRELLTVFKQANHKINAKPRSIVNFIDELNNLYHKQKQAEMNKGYYIKSETGEYVATYKGTFCFLYKLLPIVSWIYVYQRERYIKKWVDDVDE